MNTLYFTTIKNSIFIFDIYIMKFPLLIVVLKIILTLSGFLLCCYNYLFSVSIYCEFVLIVPGCEYKGRQSMSVKL